MYFPPTVEDEEPTHPVSSEPTGENVQANEEMAPPEPMTTADFANEEMAAPEPMTATDFANEDELDLEAVLESSEYTIVNGEYMEVPADEPMLDDPVAILQTFMLPGGYHAGTCFQVASLQPPITPESLAELDMPRIINNPKLRHDINFDRELHFRPNLDGPRGQQKMRAAEEYWKALEGELFLYSYVQRKMRSDAEAGNYGHWAGLLISSTRRLPNVFAAIRDILKSLVPDDDQQSIIDKLDVDFIMQELQNGVCDLVDLGNWLSRVLKVHCAPMRDPQVDTMRVTIQEGVEEDKPDVLVNGIRLLMSMLESMKLDVANHQIRHMRSILIEDTVNFEQRYNAHRIANGRIDEEAARDWFELERTSIEYTYREARPLEALTAAVLRGLLDPEYQAYPRTFYLDEERLSTLRADLYYPIYQLCARDVMLEMAKTANASQPEIARAEVYLASQVRSIVGNSSKWVERLGDIAVVIMRIVLRLERRGEDVVDAMLLQFTEDRLLEDMRPESVCFQKHAQDVFDRINPKIVASVEGNVHLNELMLQDKFLPPSSPVPFQTQPYAMGATMAPPPAPRSSDPDVDIVRRFTHILVLHWHVWGELVYMPPANDEDGEGELGEGSNNQPPGPQYPTVPVAQAVYSPGRKWLPVAVTMTEVPTGLPTPSPSVTDPRSLSPTPFDGDAQPRGSEGNTDDDTQDADDDPPSGVSGVESDGHHVA